MMITKKIQKILNSYWLKKTNQKAFHAYPSNMLGSYPVCGVLLPISDLSQMDIPGDRSKLCNDCHFELYGFPVKSLAKKKNKEKLT